MAQRAGPGSRQTNTAGAKGGTVVLIEGRHTNLGNAYNPSSTAKRRTNNPRDKECSQWDVRSAHKPHDTEGGHGERKQVHTSSSTQRPAGSWNKCAQALRSRVRARALRQVHKPTTQRMDFGNWESSAHSPATQRVSLGGWGLPTQVAVTQKDPHKHLSSKFLPAAQGGTGEQMHRQWSQGQVGDWLHCSYAESHFETAAEIDAPNTAKARTTAQKHTEPKDTPKPTTGHRTALQREEIQLHQPEHRHKLRQPGKSLRTLTQPYPLRQTWQLRTDLENP